MIHAFMNTDILGGLMTLLAVSALIVLVLVARQPVAKRFGAQAAYCLWLIPFARLALPPLPDAWTLSSSSLSPSASAMTNQVTHTPALSPLTTAQPHLTAAPMPTADAAPLFSAASSAITDPSIWMNFGLALLAVWALGAFFLAIRGFVRQHHYMKVIDADLIAASPELNRMAAALAEQIGLSRTPRIALSLVTSGPMVTGLTRPIILLPAWFEQDYTHSEQRAAIAHELTHVKRGDLWAIQLSELFVAALWFNPLAYMARRSFRCDQEAACDSDVLRSGAATPHQYGSTLIKAVKLSFAEKRPAFAAGLPHDNEIKQRLLLIAAPVPSVRKRRVGTGLTALAGAAAVMLTASTAVAGAPLDTEPDDAQHDVTVHGITMDGHKIHINGEEVTGRSFELLSDPFEGIQPTDAELKRIDEITHERETVLLDMMPPAPPVPAMPALEGLGALDSEALQERAQAFAQKHATEIEAYAHEFEANVEVNAAAFETEIKNWEKQYGNAMREWEATNGKQIREWAQKLEAEIEAVYGENFEARMRNASKTLERLVDQCKDADLVVGEEQIFEQTRSDGKIFKIKCTGTET